MRIELKFIKSSQQRLILIFEEYKNDKRLRIMLVETLVLSLLYIVHYIL